MTALVNQPTAAPVRKVRVSAIVAAVVVVALSIVDAAELVTLPVWVVAPATAVAAVGSAYLARSAAVEAPLS